MIETDMMEMSIKEANNISGMKLKTAKVSKLAVSTLENGLA
jgi:hypothetical protein